MQTLPHAILTAPASRGDGAKTSEIGQTQARQQNQPPQSDAAAKPESLSFEDAFAKSASRQDVAINEVPEPAKTQKNDAEAEQDASEENTEDAGDGPKRGQNSAEVITAAPPPVDRSAAGKAPVEAADSGGQGRLGSHSAVIFAQNDAQRMSVRPVDPLRPSTAGQSVASMQIMSIPSAKGQSTTQGPATTAKTNLGSISTSPQTTAILGHVTDITGEALGSKLNEALPSSVAAKSHSAGLEPAPLASHEKGGSVPIVVQPKVTNAPATTTPTQIPLAGTASTANLLSPVLPPNAENNAASTPVATGVNRGSATILPDSPTPPQAVAKQPLQKGSLPLEKPSANALRFTDRHAPSVENPQGAAQPQKATSAPAVSPASIADQTRLETAKVGTATATETPRMRRDAGPEVMRTKVPVISPAAAQSPGAAQTTPTLKSLLSDTPSEPRSFSEPLFTTSRAEQATSQAIQTNAVHRADLPPQTLRQIADILTQMPARPVEIALSPEELGRLRMTVRVSEGSIIVNMLAERPETLDLLRRHIDHLSEDFRNMGFANIAFSFAGEGGSAPEGGETENKTTLFADLDAEEPAPHVASHPSTGISASGLDLRL